jgi:hypothetical protein
MDGFVLVGGPVVTVAACAGVYGSPILFHNILKLLETCLKALDMRDNSACDELRMKPDVSERCMREWGPGALAFWRSPQSEAALASLTAFSPLRLHMSRKMILGLPDSLPRLVEAKFQTAKASSSLLFSPTELSIVRTSTGLPASVPHTKPTAAVSHSR